MTIKRLTDFRSDRTQPGKACISNPREGIGSAGQHQVGAPGAQRLEGVRDGEVAGRAGRGNYAVDAGEIELAGPVRCNQVARIPMNEARSNLVQGIGNVVIIESFDLTRLS